MYYYLLLITLIFIEGANGQTFHYDYTQYD